MPYSSKNFCLKNIFVWKTFLSADQEDKFKSQMLEIKVEILVLFSILIQDLDWPSTRWSVWSFIALHFGFEKHTANIFHCIRLHWSLLLPCSVFRRKEKEILLFEWALFQITQPIEFEFTKKHWLSAHLSKLHIQQINNKYEGISHSLIFNLHGLSTLFCSAQSYKFMCGRRGCYWTAVL